MCDNCIQYQLDLHSEKERRKRVESQCKYLLYELKGQDTELETIKSTLLKRVSEAENQMQVMMQVRCGEVEEAKNAAGILRSSLVKLQTMHTEEKAEMELEIQQLRAAKKMAIEWEGQLKKLENEKSRLAAKHNRSEAIKAELSNELLEMRKELSMNASKVSQLSNTNSELSTELCKTKTSLQRMSFRVETVTKQNVELRREVEKVSQSNSQALQDARQASERRAAAGSALTAVRQRADQLTNRVSQLERELATEKARVAERSTSQDAELAKLQRRLVAIKGEAVRWKRSYLVEQQKYSEIASQAQTSLRSAGENCDRLKAEVARLHSLNKSCREDLALAKREAVKEATDASSRLLIALTTSEEGVCTAMELKRCIEERLQPELDECKNRCQQAEQETQEWQKKCAKLEGELHRCQQLSLEIEERLTRQQSDSNAEIEELRHKLSQVEEKLAEKTAKLTEAEEKAAKEDRQLAELRQTYEQLHVSSDDRQSALLKELSDLRSVHENTLEKLKSVRQSVGHLSSAKNNALADVARLQNELNEARNAHSLAVATRDSERETVTKELDAASHKLADLQEELRKVREETSLKLKESSAKNVQLISHLQRKFLKHSQQSTQLQDLRLLADSLRQLLQEPETSQKATAEKSHDLTESLLTCSERRIHELEDRLTERDREMRQLEQTVITRTLELNSRAKELEKLRANMEDCNLAVEKRLQKEVDRLTAVNRELEDKLKEMDRATSQAESENSVLGSRIAALEEQLVTCKNMQTAELNERRLTLTSLRHMYEQRLATLQEQYDKSTQCLLETKESYAKDLGSKQSALDQLHQANRRQEQLIDQLRSDLTCCQNLRQTQDAEAEALRHRLSAMQTEVQLMDSQLAAVAGQRQQVLLDAESRLLAMSPGKAVAQVVANAAAVLLPRQASPPVSSVCADSNSDVDAESGTGLRSASADWLRPAVRCSAHDPWNASVDGAGDQLIGRGIGCPSTAADDLEALIRQVTTNLDEETM